MSTSRRTVTSLLSAGRAGRTIALLSAAMLLLGGTLAAAAVKAGRYSGSTSEGGAVTLTISANKKTITHFNALIGYNGKCGPGGGPTLTAAPVTISIGRGGAFSLAVRLTLHAAVNVNDPGRVFGRVSGSTVTGTVEQFFGGKLNKCYVESFTAHRV